MTATGTGPAAPPSERTTRATSRVAPGRRRRVPPSLALGVAYWGSLTTLSTVLAMWFLGMFSRPFDIPLVYSGDALSGGSQIKGTLENGWYEHNPALNAPFGQNLHDFPTADNLQFVLARVFGLFTSDWASVYNLIFLASFPLTALAATWFMRVAGARKVTAYVFGILYAFTPYHFIHSQPHLALSLLFAVPMFSVLLLKALAAQPLFARRGSTRWWNPLGWLTGPTLVTLGVLVVAGSTSSYYAVFGLILMSVSALVLLLRRRIRAAVAAVVSMGGLVFVMLVNMAPDVLYARSVPPSPAAFERQPLESEIYALKFASLVFPAPWHRIGALSRFRLNYDGTFANPGESPTLGIVATIGFLFLLALPLLVTLGRRPVDDEGTTGRTQQHLALLTLVAFLFGTIGGLGTLFALFISSDIRAWNRIVTFIAVFALASVALLLDRGVTALLRRRPAWSPRMRQGTALAACGAVLVVGLWDEAAPKTWISADGSEVTTWRNDETYVSAIEDEVPPGTSIFELPVLSFPESLPVFDMHDYDPIRPYLHSTDLKWSYGGVKGRPSADWQTVVGTLPVLRLAVALGASGFGGIHVDRYGYAGHDSGDVDDYLTELLGAPIVSPDGRFAFYDMTDFDKQLEQEYTPKELASIKRHTLRQPVFYWEPGFTGPPVSDGHGNLVLVGRDADPHAIVDNPGAPLPMKLTFTIAANGATSYPTDVDVTWPDGKKQTVSVDADGTEVSHTFTAASGQSTMEVTGLGLTSVNLLNLALRDPGLYFGLKGRVAELAAAHSDDRKEDRAAGATGAATSGRTGRG